jgi:hypothetical protein
MKNICECSLFCFSFVAQLVIGIYKNSVCFSCAYFASIEILISNTFLEVGGVFDWSIKAKWNWLLLFNALRYLNQTLKCNKMGWCQNRKKWMSESLIYQLRLTFETEYSNLIKLLLLNLSCCQKNLVI